MHIEKRGKSLLVRFTHESKNYSFSLPNHNNPVGLSNAKLKIAQIDKDIRSHIPHFGFYDKKILFKINGKE